MAAGSDYLGEVPPSYVYDDEFEVDSTEMLLAKDNIKKAFRAGLVSGTLTMIVAIVATAAGTSIIGLDSWAWVDVIFIFGLAFGIYYRSRACALTMFVYFLLSKISMMASTGKATGIVPAFVFCYYYAKGVSGTFQYHKLRTGK